MMLFGTMTSKKDLQSLRSILEKPGAWIQYHMARDGNGAVIDPVEKEACSFCLRGAAFHMFPSIDE